MCEKLLLAVIFDHTYINIVLCVASSAESTISSDRGRGEKRKREHFEEHLEPAESVQSEGKKGSNKTCIEND